MSKIRGKDEKKLSKAVLDLKFMKKSKEKRIIRDEEEEQQKLYEGHLSLLHEGADRITMVNSYFDCRRFLPCRLSFGGMDPEIEKLNADKLTGLYKVIKEDSSNDDTVTGMNADFDEEEMAETLLAGNMRKKFAVKRKSEPLDPEDENGAKKFKPSQASGRQLFTRGVDRGGFRGRGDFRGRGRGGLQDRGRGDFRGRGRGRGDFGGRGDSPGRGRGQGDSPGRGRGDFRNRGRGDFKSRGGRGDFKSRGGRGDFKNRGGRGDFKGSGGRGDFEGSGERRDFKGSGERRDFKGSGGKGDFKFNFKGTGGGNSMKREEDSAS